MKMFALVFAFFAVLTPCAALGNPSFELRINHSRKLNKNKLWNLAALPAYFMLETALHEGSHAAAAIACGDKVTAFKPYPHTHDGLFFWGRVSYKGELQLKKTDVALILMAPYMTDVLIFTSADLLLGYHLIPPESIAGLIAYSVGMVAPWINFVYNVNNPRAISDFSRVAKITGVNRWALAAAGDAVAVFAAWRIWARGKEVLFSGGAVKEKPNRIAFAPLLGDVKGVMAKVNF